MNKWLLLLMAFGLMPWSASAQDDDMYFVPSKKTATTVTPRNTQNNGESYRTPRSTYYSGSNRSVDDYNRRGGSYYQVVPSDTTANDIIDFSAVEGVYPDSTMQMDYALTREMSRWDGYAPEEVYAEGYDDGLRDGKRKAWHSPWYYSSWYGWYDPWYDPWYYDPWYYGYYGYRGYYGWYTPYWYGTYWDWEYYHYGYYPSYYYYGGGWSVPHYHASVRTTGNSGTIDRWGTTHGHFTANRGTSASSSGGGRFSTARSRTLAGHSSYGSQERSVARTTSRAASSASGNFRGIRSTNSGNFQSTTNNSSSSFIGSRSSSSSSYSGSSSSSSSSFSGSSSRGSSMGGSFSGGGSRGGGGGGGGRLGGRR